MIKSKDEILALIKERIGEDTSDEAIQIVEDVPDTLNDYEWRKKYRDRFFEGEAPKEKESEEETEEVKSYSYEDLFKEE